MEIETPNAIKLFFPNPSLVQVYFEAIANSLDAGAENISIQIEIQNFSAPESLKISIADDGRELLALQVLLNKSEPSKSDWVLWTPEGFYEATPGGRTF